jgi:alpha-1,3-rhamnosyl/mannosyltransferase
MPKRHILFDAGPILDHRKSGVGHYVEYLVGSLADNFKDELQLTGYYFDFLDRHRKAPPMGSKWIGLKIRYIPGKLLALCRRLGFQPPLELFARIPKDVDAVIFTNYVSMPLIKRRKKVVVVYDLSFLDVPEYAHPINLKYLQRFCPPSVKSADIVITISEFTKQRLQHYFPDLTAKIVVTPIPPQQNEIGVKEIGGRLEELGVKAKGYILYMGTVEPRKNLETLMQAYVKLSPEIKNKYSLVIAGGKGWKDESILKSLKRCQDEGHNIITTGYVSSAEKSALYANASCFVLASHYEGFGMPLLEAMQHDIPVISSDIPVFHEVAASAALYFDKESSDELCSQISKLLNNAVIRSKLVRAGHERLSAFRWDKNAEEVWGALKD